MLFAPSKRQMVWLESKTGYRVYPELEQNLRFKPRKRLVREKPEPLAVPETINDIWSMDFMHDQLGDGRSYRLLNVIDDFSWEGLGIEVNRRQSVLSARWTRSLNGPGKRVLFAVTMGYRSSLD